MPIQFGDNYTVLVDSSILYFGHFKDLIDMIFYRQKLFAHLE